MLVVRTRPDPVAGQRELRSSTTLAGLPLTPIQTSSNDVRLFVPYVRDCQPRVLCRTVGAGTTDGISATEMAPTASVCRYCSWFASSWSTMHAPADPAGTGLHAPPRPTAGPTSVRAPQAGEGRTAPFLPPRRPPSPPMEGQLSLARPSPSPRRTPSPGPAFLWASRPLPAALQGVPPSAGQAVSHTAGPSL